MWMVENQSPYAARANWLRDEHGRHVWLVAVRATFDVMSQGPLRLADDQPEPALLPEYAGAPGRSSLRWDADLLFVKPSTDVVAEACAHAPGSRPVESIDVQLRVGPIAKRLKVFGPRVFYRGAASLSLSSAAPFVCQAISYEHSYGGADFVDPDPAKHRLDDRNPVGRGFATNVSHLVDTLAPAIEYPSASLESAGPAGFGPIDPSWVPRRLYGGTYDTAWEKHRKPLLPADYDARYACSAPADQCARGYLHGAERVELVGMTPGGLSTFELPGVRPTFATRFGSKSTEHTGNLATILLQPELSRVSLVWQTTLMVPANDIDYLDATRVGWEYL